MDPAVSAPVVAELPADLPSMGSSIAASLVSLGLVCLVAYLVLRWLARKTSVTAPGGGPLRVLARQNIDPRRSVIVVEAAERCFLVGAGEGGMNLIAELDRTTVLRDLEQARPVRRALPGRFSEVLTRVLARPAKPARQAEGVLADTTVTPALPAPSAGEP